MTKPSLLTKWSALAVFAVAASLSQPAFADDADLAKKYAEAVNQGVEFLKTKGQAEDGSFNSRFGPAITSMATAAMLRSGRTPSDPAVAKALKYLEGFAQPSGGIHPEESRTKNYDTCLAILAFAEANKDGRYDKLLKKAEAYIKGLQWDGEEGHDESSVHYGGAGYGRKSRPDLSNTQFLIEALKATGNGPEDEAMQKALTFVSRCQNLETEHNTTPFAAKVNDGGFYYTPANGGESQAGETANGGLRSYASMTYAGLKSMIYAGVGPDDPRVKAAYDWARKHYGLEENPGMGQQGLYYYYHTFAKALDAMDVDVVTDAKGEKHHWRKELIKELLQRQRPDGSWANDNPRWLEGDPNLTTSYALLTLSYLRPAVEQSK